LVSKDFEDTLPESDTGCSRFYPYPIYDY
jgi:hypothetical protein